MSRRASAATLVPFQPWKKQSSTNEQCSTSRGTEERWDNRALSQFECAAMRFGGDDCFDIGEEPLAQTGKKSGKMWSSRVKTDSTHPSEGLFTKDPETIARSLASKRVSPKGPASGMRMLTFFINRAGKNLSATRRAKLQKAKELLSERVKAARPK